MSAVILHNEITHYEVLGRGRPLLFLHDWVGSWRYWISTMQAASLSYRTYAIDLWGFGDTAKNPAYYSIHQQAMLLEEFMDAMGINKIAIIGHGLGAVAGLVYTERYPESVDRILAVGYPHHINAVNSRLRSSEPVELADWLLGRSPTTEAAWSEAGKSDPIAISASLEDIQDLDLPTLPDRSTRPVLLVHGKNDPAVDPPELDEVAQWGMNTHWILLEGSGRFPMLDEPGKFNRLLTDFLSLSSGESPRQLQLKDEWKRRIR
jgi:pimeloyl-ACP methyl ester carboxylesterase